VCRCGADGRPRPYTSSQPGVNPKLQGWLNYYGHLYRSALLPILWALNEHLARLARRKYKRLSNSRDRAYRLLRRV
jgi:RNA-directed DNA polymerase